MVRDPWRYERMFRWLRTVTVGREHDKVKPIGKKWSNLRVTAQHGGRRASRLQPSLDRLVTDVLSGQGVCRLAATPSCRQGRSGRTLRTGWRRQRNAGRDRCDLLVGWWRS